MSGLQHNYQLLTVQESAFPGCISHKDIPIEHLFANSNWKMDQDGDLIYKFTCLQCGQVRIYKRLTEKTLL